MTIENNENVWRNRIIGLEWKPANQLMANPHNPRIHPIVQREALRDSLGKVGWYDVVIENRITGELIDGHARVEEALTIDETMLLPVLVVELAPQEQDLVSLEHDWITTLAEYDKDNIQYLVDNIHEHIELSSDSIETMMTELMAIGLQDTKPLDTGDENPHIPKTQSESQWIECPHCGERFEVKN